MQDKEKGKKKIKRTANKANNSIGIADKTVINRVQELKNKKNKANNKFNNTKIFLLKAKKLFLIIVLYSTLLLFHS